MQLVNEAYVVLMDPERRREHNRWIAEQEEAFQSTKFSPAAEDPPSEPVREERVRESVEPKRGGETAEDATGMQPLQDVAALRGALHLLVEQRDGRIRRASLRYAMLGAVGASGMSVFWSRFVDPDWILQLFIWFMSGGLAGFLVGIAVGFVVSDRRSIMAATQALKSAEEASMPRGDKLLMLAGAVMVAFFSTGVFTTRIIHPEVSLNGYWLGTGVVFAGAITIPAFLCSLAYPTFQWLAGRQFMTWHMIYLLGPGAF